MAQVIREWESGKSLTELVREANQGGYLSGELARVRGREMPDREPDPHEAVMQQLRQIEEE